MVPVVSNVTGSQGELVSQKPPVEDEPGDCVTVICAAQLNDVWKLSLALNTLEASVCPNNALRHRGRVREQVWAAERALASSASNHLRTR